MLQGILWFLNDSISDLLLAGIFIFVAIHYRQMKIMQQRTSQLAFQVSELKVLMMTTPGGSVPNEPSVIQRSPSMRFDETTLSS